MLIHSWYQAEDVSPAGPHGQDAGWYIGHSALNNTLEENPGRQYTLS